MAAMLKDLQRKMSNTNANGELLCGLACVDLVEDRVYECRDLRTLIAFLCSHSCARHC